jgi:NAD-dependent SIR2 family protein deacetylase
MPLTSQCTDCHKSYSYPALEKDVQTGRCPDCEHTYQVKHMNLDIDTLQAHIDSIRPTLCHLNQAKHDAKAAYLKAEAAWEDLARDHAILTRKVAIITHERDLLTKAKEVTPPKGRPAKTPEQKALEALKNLPAAARAAILQQLKEQQNG